MDNKCKFIFASLIIIPRTLFAIPEPIHIEKFEKMEGIFKSSASIEKIYYMIPSIKGGVVKSSAVLIRPQKSAKNTNNGLVVLTYGTVGAASKCAPLWGVNSNDKPDFLNIPSYWDSASYSTIDYYLNNGLTVLAVNKEGQANKDFETTASYGEPYGNKNSMVKSVHYALLAASHILGDDFSGNWAITGHSQGGQTVFAVSEELKNIYSNNKKLNFLGGVALSPAMDIYDIFKERRNSILKYSKNMNINDGDGEMVKTATLSINFIQSMIDSGFKPKVENIIGGDILKNFLKLTKGLCVSNQMEFINQDITRWRFQHAEESVMNYDGFNINAFLNDSEVKKAMSEWSVVNGTPQGRILVIAGDRDEFVPFTSVLKGVNKIKTHGGHVDFKRIENGDHQGYIRLANIQDVIQNYVMALFSKPNLKE